MNQQMAMIDRVPRRVFPWHGLFWVALTLTITARAFGVMETRWTLTIIPWVILIGGSAARGGDYALSRRRHPKALVAAFLGAIVVAVAAVLIDDPSWWSTLARALPAAPAAGFAYLHLRTPPPPNAAPAPETA